jgi:hypothetical protein
VQHTDHAVPRSVLSWSPEEVVGRRIKVRPGIKTLQLVLTCGSGSIVRFVVLTAVFPCNPNTQRNIPKRLNLLPTDSEGLVPDPCPTQHHGLQRIR